MKAELDLREKEIYKYTNQCWDTDQRKTKIRRARKTQTEY